MRDHILAEIAVMADNGQGRLPAKPSVLYTAIGNAQETTKYIAMLDVVIFGPGVDLESLCWKNTACFFAWLLFRETFASYIFPKLDNQDVWETFTIIASHIDTRFVIELTRDVRRPSGSDPGVVHPELDGTFVGEYSAADDDNDDDDDDDDCFADLGAPISSDAAEELIEDVRRLTSLLFRHPQSGEWTVQEVHTKRGTCAYTLGDGRVVDFKELQALVCQSVIAEEDIHDQ